MSTFIEAQNSRDLELVKDGSKIIEIYKVADGGDDPYTLLAELPAIGSPHPVVEGTLLKSAKIKVLEAEDYMQVIYVYEPLKKGDVNIHDEVWEYDMTSRTQHIDSVESSGDDPVLPNQDTYNATHYSTPIQVESLIGIDDDNVKGVDVFRPNGSLQVTKTYEPASIFGEDERDIVWAAQNTTNNNTWHDWAKGEVLFLGARMRYSEVNDVAKATYNFLFGRTQFGVRFDVWDTSPVQSPPNSITTQITIAKLLPFEYLWGNPTKNKVRYSAAVAKPFLTEKHFTSINVATVYPESNFDLLELLGPQPSGS